MALTRDQIIANIDALEKQGASRTDIQGYLSSLSSQRVTPTLPQSTQRDISGKVSDFFLGAGKGVLSTARESSSLINSASKFLPDSVKKSFANNPVTAPLTVATRVASKVSPSLSSLEQKTNQPQGSITKPVSPSEKAGFVTERVAEFVNPTTLAKTASVIKTPLTIAAEKLYQSAMKPKNVYKGGKLVTKAEDIVKTGLKERVWLTQGGVERVANKIDDFEAQLGDAIAQAKGTGASIKLDGLKEYLNEAKRMFKGDFDVKKAEEAVAAVDDIYNSFVKKYGKEIPIDVAQEIKVSTGQLLKKYYNTLSGAEQEARKQGVRYLKDKIVEKAPVVGDVNKRLKSLYEFDKSLATASNRIKNLNLLGLGAKAGTAVSGSKGAAVGLLADLADSPLLKSGAAIGVNELSKLASPKGVIPLNALVGYIRSQIEKNN